MKGISFQYKFKFLAFLNLVSIIRIPHLDDFSAVTFEKKKRIVNQLYLVDAKKPYSHH